MAAINVSLQAQSVGAQEEPEAFLGTVRQAALATVELISGDLSGGR